MSINIKIHSIKAPISMSDKSEGERDSDIAHLRRRERETMGKNRNRNRRNRTTKIGAKDIMKEIMMYQDSGIILDSITERKTIASAAANIVGDDSEIDAFERMVDDFRIMLDSEETLAIVTVMKSVIHNLGDLPANVSEIPEMVYSEFVDYIGAHTDDSTCIKAYDTILSVSEIVLSDLDDAGLSLSDDTVTRLAIVEAIYTAVDTVATQIWNESQMAASASNIPDRETVEQVEMPKKDVEKISDDDVEVIDETESKSKDEGPQLNIFGVTNEEMSKMSVEDIMALEGVNEIIDELKKSMGPLASTFTDKTTDAFKEFLKSLITDAMSAEQETGDARKSTNYTSSMKTKKTARVTDESQLMVIGKPNQRRNDIKVISTDIENDVIGFVRGYTMFKSCTDTDIRSEIVSSVDDYVSNKKNAEILKRDYRDARKILIDSVKKSVLNRLGERLIGDRDSRTITKVDKNGDQLKSAIRNSSDRCERGLDAFVKCGVGFLPSFN